jgi:hypothetical protein
VHPLRAGLHQRLKDVVRALIVLTLCHTIRASGVCVILVEQLVQCRSPLGGEDGFSLKVVRITYHQLWALELTLHVAHNRGHRDVQIFRLLLGQETDGLSRLDLVGLVPDLVYWAAQPSCFKTVKVFRCISPDRLLSGRRLHLGEFLEGRHLPEAAGPLWRKLRPLNRFWRSSHDCHYLFLRKDF